MKKIITTLLFFAALPLFAQSNLYKKSFMGYRDCYWGQNLTEIQLDKQIHFINNHLTEPARIMGQQSAFNYYFNNKNQLEAIAYTIDYSEETLERLVTKITETYKDVRINYTDFFKKILEEATPEELEEYKKKISYLKQKQGFEYLIIDDLYGYNNGSDSICADCLNNQSDKDKSKVGIIQAQVNAGTQLFIAFNWFWENKIVAIYCGIPEDNF